MVSDQSDTSRHRARPANGKLHGYFIAFALVYAAIVLVGFSRTFFIPMARGSLVKPLVVHVHGALFFAWMALLVVQVVMAATNRLKAHRKVGSIAGWLVLPMLVLGSIVAARDTVHDFKAGEGDGALSFFYGELADLAMFGLLAGGAMLFRTKPEYHKRWVILSSLGLIGAAIGRIPEIQSQGQNIFLALIASVAAYDIAIRRTIHPATVMGAATLLLIGLSEERIGDTSIWIRTAHALLGV